MSPLINRGRGTAQSQKVEGRGTAQSEKSNGGGEGHGTMSPLINTLLRAGFRQ